MNQYDNNKTSIKINFNDDYIDPRIKLMNSKPKPINENITQEFNKTTDIKTIIKNRNGK